MNSDRSVIAEAAASILRDLSTQDVVRAVEEVGWDEKLWAGLAGSGFSLVSVPEEAGGSGGDIADACAVLTEAGRFAAPVPLAETGLLAGWALAGAGMEIPAGPATAVAVNADSSIELSREDGSWRLRGRLSRVPWADRAERVVLVVPYDGDNRVISLRREDVEVIRGHNLAGEARDTVVVPDVRLADEHVGLAADGVDSGALWVRGALGRAALLSGALARVCDLTVGYTHEREQFGRPLARFQAVQRHLVRIAEQSQAAGLAAEIAALNATPEPDFFDVASAKIVTSEAATTVAAAAHQAHGAIGMTREYELGQLTRRLWAWRDEFGGEARWSRELGRRVAAEGGAHLWPRLTAGCSPDRSRAQ